jgi:predicted ABC-type ATPase
LEIDILTGISGAGKSHYSNLKIEENLNWVCVNRDKIREMCVTNYRFWPFDGKDSKRYSNLEKSISEQSIILALENNFNVIVDETHITKKSRLNTVNLCRNAIVDQEIKINYVWFTEVENNLKYRMETPKNSTEENWRKVIGFMKKSFEKPTIEECQKNQINSLYKVSREFGKVKVF